jgi:hypothetical protein
VQKNLIHSQEKRKPIEIDPEVTEMMELAYKNFKTGLGV